MAQTIGEMMHEVECWQYSKEAYDMQKEAAELGLMAQYIENMQFSMESAEVGETFTEGYLMEAGSFDDLIAITEASEAKAEKWWQKALNAMAKFFKLLFTPFIKLYQMIKGINATNEVVATAVASTILLSSSQWTTVAETLATREYNIPTKVAAEDIVDVEAPESQKKLPDNHVSQAKLPDNHVSQAKLPDKHVSRAKLPNNNKIAGLLGLPKDYTATVTEAGDIIIAKGTEKVVVSHKMFEKKDPKQEAHAKKLQGILMDCLRKSGMNESGARLHPDQPKSGDLKIFGFKGNVNNAKGNNLSLQLLMYCALTGFQVRLSTQGTNVASVEDIITLYNLMCDPNNKKLNDFTPIKKMIDDARRKANADGIYVKVDDASVDKNTKDLNSIREALPKMGEKLAAAIKESVDVFEEARNNGGKVWAQAQQNKQKAQQVGKDKDPHQKIPEVAKQNAAINIENAKARAAGTNDMQQVVNNLSVMVPNIIKISNALVKYKSMSGTAIKKYLAGKSDDAGYELDETQAS